MSEQAEPKKRRGRPPMNREDRKGGNLTFRVRDGMREWLQASAEARGLSISEEVEKRLEQSRQQAADPYMDTALRMAAANCDVIGQLLGKGIAEDPFTRTACAKAASAAIELVGGLAGQDTPEARALLQADQQAYAEDLGQRVAMFSKALLDGASKDATDGLGQIIEALAQRRRAEIAESDHRYRQTLARLLREGAPAQPPTPDEVAGMVDARGQLPPEIGDRAAFDDAVAGLPLVQAERKASVEDAAEHAIAPALKRRAKAKAKA